MASASGAPTCPKCGTDLRLPLPKFCTKCGADLTLHVPKAAPKTVDRKLLFGLGGGALATVAVLGIYFGVIKKEPEQEVVPKKIAPVEDPRDSDDPNFQSDFGNSWRAYVEQRAKFNKWYPPIGSHYLDKEPRAFQDLVEGYRKSKEFQQATLEDALKKVSLKALKTCAVESKQQVDFLWKKLEPKMITIGSEGGVDRLSRILDELNLPRDYPTMSYLCDKDGCPSWITEEASQTQRGDLTFACDQALMTYDLETVNAACSSPRNQANFTIKLIEMTTTAEMAGKSQNYTDLIRSMYAQTDNFRDHGYLYYNLGAYNRSYGDQDEVLNYFFTADNKGRLHGDHETWLTNANLSVAYLARKQMSLSMEHLSKAFYDSPPNCLPIRKVTGIAALFVNSFVGDPDKVLRMVEEMTRTKIQDPTMDWVSYKVYGRKENYPKAIEFAKKYKAAITDKAKIDQVNSDITNYLVFDEQRKYREKMEEEREKRGGMIREETRPPEYSKSGTVIVKPNPLAASGSQDVSASPGL